MSEVTVFNYNGSNITFNNGECVMVNATEMAKPFGKQVFHWFENESTLDFIMALARSKGINTDSGNPRSLNTSELAKAYPSLIKVVRGGLVGQITQGTWVHEDVALEFARWLSPEFAIWCNDRIKELMKYGFTATPQKLDELINDPDLLIRLATQLKEERQKNLELQKENEHKSNEIAARKERNKEDHETIIRKTVENIALKRKNKKLTDRINDDAPKISYYHQCAEAADDSAISFRDTAAMLEIPEKEFIRTLIDAHIIYRSKGKLRAYSKYLDEGYFRITEYPNGKGECYYQTKVTVKGRTYLNDNWERILLSIKRHK